MLKTSRNYGIDILRIVSILGVAFLHVLGHGGILYLPHSFLNFSTAWFFEILAYPAVNCFVLISGYVGYRGEKVFPKIKSILSLLFTVLFYSISIFCLFKLFYPETAALNAPSISLMPTIMGRYWFFTAYFGLFLLTPILNTFVHRSNLKQAFVFIVVLSLFVIITLKRDAFTTANGYSVLWFVFMYLLGAIIKKYDLSSLFSKKIWLLIVLVAFLITWVSKVGLHFFKITFWGFNSDVFVKYTSPTIILMAVGLLCFFSKINCPSNLSKAISFFSSSAFSVYLIHDNFYIRTQFISKLHTFITGFNPVYLALFIIFSATAIFLLCTLIDKLRILLFNLAKIDKITVWIEQVIKRKINTLYKKLELRLEKASK